MEPATIAAQLRELAVYYGLEGDRHRAGAYERAARSIQATNNLPRLIAEGRLEELPAVGAAIARIVEELARQGTVSTLERLRAAWPAVVIELAELPHVGAAKARKIHEALAPANLEALAAMCRAGALRELPGFGKVSEAKILGAIEERRANPGGDDIILVEAEERAEALLAHLRAGGDRVELAGPVRRFLPAIDHLAFAAASEAVLARLASYPLMTSVERGVGYLSGTLRVEVHVAPPERFGWALIVATGSPAHVTALEERARRMGVEVDGPEETDVYARLGLAFIPPEVRDGTDELDDDFSDLVTLADVTAAFHCHTTYSDGKASIAEMAEAAAKRGFSAITITDHSAAAGYAGGLDATRLREQHAEMASLHDPPVRLLRGTEADILADGTIDVPPELLGDLDVVIASVHQRYKQDEDATTRRLVAAMRAPFFKVWGHPLGRLVLRRDPIPVRLDEVFDAIAESPAAIELNGDPYRMDLDPEHARKARARGIRFVLSSDAHSTRGLGAVRYAVAMARRARIRKREVLNTLPPDELADAIRPLR